jgi:hypothetical protein
MVGSVAVVLTGLSLTHLSHGITIVTQAPQWEAWAMAVGVDLLFVALEVGNLTCREQVRKMIKQWIVPATIGTVAGSAILNGFAFGAAASGWLVAPAVALGVAIPALIYASVRASAIMWLHR